MGGDGAEERTERVVIIGASIGGLATALALKHGGRELVIVDRDDPPPEIAPGSAFDGWDRSGVPHFRLSHSLLARLPAMLRQSHPELLQELAQAGIEPCPIEFALPSNQVDTYRPQRSDIDLRHLRPGGRLVTLDMLVQPNQKFGWLGRLIGGICCHFWQVCRANVYDRDEYARRLRAIGYENVRVETIFEDTMVPFSFYALTELMKPEVFRRLNWTVAMMVGMPAWAILDKRWPVVTPDYILAVADKPHSTH